MKRIPLRRRDGSIRAHALVDDDLLEWLSQWRWCVKLNKGKMYAARSEHVRYRDDGRKVVRNVSMHRQIMGFPNVEIDHKDGDGLNNQRRNLRVVSHAENGQNLRTQARSRTGARGVTIRRGRYRARVRQKELGTYETLHEAVRVAEAYRQQNMPFAREATYR